MQSEVWREIIYGGKKPKYLFKKKKTLFVFSWEFFQIGRNYDMGEINKITLALLFII